MIYKQVTMKTVAKYLLHCLFCSSSLVSNRNVDTVVLPISEFEKWKFYFVMYKITNFYLFNFNSAKKAHTFSLQLESMLIMLRQTDCTERAGDQSSVKMDKQIWPLL